MSKRKIFAFLLAVMMLVCAACGGDAEESSVQESSVAESSKEESSKDEESSKAESSKEESSQEESSIVEESSVEEVLIPEGELNLLTGTYTLTDEAVGKRPVAIMINNIKASLPQYGIAGADIIFEMIAEEGISRMMAIWGDYTQIPNVCSVRSARPYYVEFAAGFDAVYVHVGGSQAGLDRLDQLNLANFDGRYSDSLIFARDQERLQSYALEHTMYVKGENLPERIQAYGYRTDLAEGYTDTVFQFNDPGTPVSNTDKACEELIVWFSSEYFSTFTYNEDDQLYYKQHSGEPHMVQDTDTQLVFTNILALETNVWSTDGYRMDMDSTGGTGYYFSNGVVQEIIWSKPSPYDRITITDTEGNEIKLNAGKTYIGITEYDEIEIR